jgi:hypothetical protein
MADLFVEYNVGLTDLQKFKDLGEFSNNIDEFGNFQLIYNNVAQQDGKVYYTKMPLRVLDYNDEKILDTNNPGFEELQSEDRKEQQDVNQILEQYNIAIEENRILNQTVNSLVQKYENNDDKQVITAMQKELIGLRIQLGQGNVPSDFSDQFPFLPLEN